MTKFAATHYERNSKNAPWAKSRLAQSNFATAVSEAVANKPLAMVDVLREHMRPVAHLDFDSVVRTPQFAAIHGFVSWLAERAQGAGMAQAVNGEVLTQSIMAWHTCRYDHGGRQTYVPTPALSRLLLATELRGLRCADMVLPYPSVYIAVDPSLGFTVHNEQTGAHPLYGVYLTVDSMDDRPGWRVLLCGDRNDNSSGEWDDALSHFYIDLGDAERPIADVIKELFTLVRSRGPAWCQQQGIKDADLDEVIDSWETAFKWCMNLMFYVTRPDFKDLEHVEANPEAAALWRRMQNAPKGSKKRERILDQYRATPKQPRIVVGRRVVLDSRLPSNVGEAMRALRVRTFVPAHWQRYHVGPRGSGEVVWKQKDPYWRGPDDAEVSSPVHEVR